MCGVRGVTVLLGSPKLPAHLEMFNHVEAVSVLSDNASDMSSPDDHDTLSRDIAHELGVTPLVSCLTCVLSKLSLCLCSYQPILVCFCVVVIIISLSGKLVAALQ